MEEKFRRWKAWACRLVTDPHDLEQGLILEPIKETDIAQPAFEAAAKRVSAYWDGIETPLKTGVLSYPPSARILEYATGESPFGCEWLPAKVQELAARTNWMFAADRHDLGFKAAAHAFLDVCAEHGLAIKFD